MFRMKRLICAKFGKDLFNISEVIGRKKVAQFFLTHSVEATYFSSFLRPTVPELSLFDFLHYSVLTWLGPVLPRGMCRPHPWTEPRFWSLCLLCNDLPSSAWHECLGTDFCDPSVSSWCCGIRPTKCVLLIDWYWFAIVAVKCFCCPLLFEFELLWCFCIFCFVWTRTSLRQIVIYTHACPVFWVSAVITAVKLLRLRRGFKYVEVGDAVFLSSQFTHHQLWLCRE